MIDDKRPLANSDIDWVHYDAFEKFEARLLCKRNEGVKMVVFNGSLYRHTYDFEFELIDHFKNQWQLKNIKLTKFIPEVQILKLINED